MCKNKSLFAMNASLHDKIFVLRHTDCMLEVYLAKDIQWNNLSTDSEVELVRGEELRERILDNLNIKKYPEELTEKVAGRSDSHGG